MPQFKLATLDGTGKLPKAAVPDPPYYRATRINVHGHSIAAGVGAIKAGWSDRLASLLGTPPYVGATSDTAYRGLRKNAVGGAMVTLDEQGSGNAGGWSRAATDNSLLVSKTPALGANVGWDWLMPDNTIDVPWYGLNDLGNSGVSPRALRSYENAMHVVIATGRANSFIAVDNTSFAMKDASGNPVSPTDAPGYSISGKITPLYQGNVGTLTLPASYPGGVMTATFVAYGDGGLASSDITVKTGSTVVGNRYITEPLDFPPGNTRASFGVVPIRFTLPAGAQTVTVSNSPSAPGSCWFAGFIVEAAQEFLPLTIQPMVHLPRLSTLWGFYPPDRAGVDTYNNVLKSLQSVFGSENYKLLDVETIMKGGGSTARADFVLPDGAHPTDLGYLNISLGMYEIARNWLNTRTTRQLAAIL